MKIVAVLILYYHIAVTLVGIYLQVVHCAKYLLRIAYMKQPLLSHFNTYTDTYTHSIHQFCVNNPNLNNG